MSTQSSGGQTQNAQKQQWYADYRSGDLERSELVKMDLNALFGRAMAEKALTYLIHLAHEIYGDRSPASSHIRQVIAMVWQVLENLETPMRHDDITKLTDLHETTRCHFLPV